MKKETEASLHAFSEHGVLEEKDWDMISLKILNQKRDEK